MRSQAQLLRSLPRIDVLKSLQDLPGESHVVRSEVGCLVVDILHDPLEGGEAGGEGLELVPEDGGVRLPAAGEALLRELRIAQLSQHSLQRGLERVHLLKIFGGVEKKHDCRIEKKILL